MVLNIISSTVSNNCSTSCSNCEGVARCEPTLIDCECICPPGYVRDSPGCAGKACLNIASIKIIDWGGEGGGELK